MKLVIEIPEEDYKNIEPFLNGETIKGGFNLFKALEIIKNGKPLPKGHGRLIDESKIDWLSDPDVRWTTENRIKNTSETVIEALEQEPYEDYISRQALLKLMGEEPFNWTDSDKELQEVEDYRNFRNMVEQLPSVNPQKSGWIPVSERLPEDNELVLFSTKTDRVFEGRYFDDNTDRQWYSFRDDTFAWNNVVTAWMPLPEPMKVGEENC